MQAPLTRFHQRSPGDNRFNLRNIATRTGAVKPGVRSGEFSMKKQMWAGIALGLGIALSGAAQAQIKLGVAGPVTGPNAAFGAQLKNGAEQAVEDITAAG